MSNVNRIIGWHKFDYYQWLLELIKGNVEPYYNYSLLLAELHSIEFTWSEPMDVNRASDGERLRMRYMDEHNIPDLFYYEGVKCSVLEMMIALANKCESNLMSDGPEDNTYKWFWIMIDNLGLDVATDENFNAEYVRQQIGIWLNREFKKNGMGSPFPRKKVGTDQRHVEIWFQMCGYLCDNYYVSS